MKLKHISKKRKRYITSSSTLRAYYQLTKPGIIRGNLITALAGFLLASGRDIQLGLLFATLGSIMFIIASACVFNNYLDRGIDKKMKRTQKRALVTGAISPMMALLYSTLLGASGFALLAVCTNWLTFALGVLAFISYVAVYGYAKRKTVHGTLVGTVPGALPPVAGYTAVTGELDAAAYIIFMVLVTWQMAHFYSIAIYRQSEYAAADIPVHPRVKGVSQTQKAILVYIVLFVAATLCLSLFGYTGVIYAVVVTLLGARWLMYGVQKLRMEAPEKWARGMFGMSLLVITAWSALLYFEALLP